MKAFSFLSSLIVFFNTFGFCTDSFGGLGASQPSDSLSPRLARLVHELQAGNRQALSAFWVEMQSKTPLIEPIVEDKQHHAVTFLWRGGEEIKHVSVLGGFPGANLAKSMKRLAETDIWYLTEIHPTEARFQYVFHINGPEELPMKLGPLMKEISMNPPKPDPLNPNAYAGWSYVELPGAPPQPWITKGTAPAGNLTQLKFKSKLLNAEYSLNIYTPPGYNEIKQRCWLAIAFDGGFLNMSNTLDNLLAAGKIPPLVVIGVNNLNRGRDLGCSDEFADFLAKELVPWARKSYHIFKDPGHTIVGGTSLGGKMAAYCGLKHSQVFGKVLSQSGSFAAGTREESASDLWSGEAPKMLVREFLESPRLPVDFYLEIGRYETTLNFSPLLETRRLRDVLKAKGYKVIYSEFIGGHNEICWRGSFANAIIALTSR